MGSVKSSERNRHGVNPSGRRPVREAKSAEARIQSPGRAGSVPPILRHDTSARRLRPPSESRPDRRALADCAGPAAGSVRVPRQRLLPPLRPMRVRPRRRVTRRDSVARNNWEWMFWPTRAVRSPSNRISFSVQAGALSVTPPADGRVRAVRRRARPPRPVFPRE